MWVGAREDDDGDWRVPPELTVAGEDGVMWVGASREDDDGD